MFTLHYTVQSSGEYTILYTSNKLCEDCIYSAEKNWVHWFSSYLNISQLRCKHKTQLKTDSIRWPPSSKLYFPDRVAFLGWFQGQHFCVSMPSSLSGPRSLQWCSPCQSVQNFCIIVYFLTFWVISYRLSLAAPWTQVRTRKNELDNHLINHGGVCPGLLKG